jgi:hypothetical protein
MPRQLSLKWVGVILVVLLLSVGVYAFNGSYAPTEYDYGDATSTTATVICPGEINGEVGGGDPLPGVVNIWMNMKWNEEHAQNVRDYSSQSQYYTHDITDMSDNLNGWCLWTDFPSPYYDWDDDDGDDKWEESEVVAVDTSFPADDQMYKVRSVFIPWYWKCVWQLGWVCEWEYTATTGTAFITPAVSEWQGWPFSEYQTVHYDDDPVIISYGDPNGEPVGVAPFQAVDTSLQGSSDGLGYTSVSTIYLQGGEYTATVAIAPPNVSVSLNAPLETTDLAEYANWSRSLTGDLEQSGLEAADVVVTFNHYVAPEDFVELAEEHQIDVDVVHAEYTGVDQKVWTAYIRNLPGTDYSLLDEAAQGATQVDLTRPHGVVAVYGTAPIEQIDRLNQDSRVFLADPVGSHVSLVASQQTGAQETLDAALQQKRDILYQHIVESAEETARRTGRRAEDLLDSIDIEQAINAFFDQNPEQLPQVDIQVYDLWNVLAKETIDLSIDQGYPALTIGNHNASSVHVAVSHYKPNGDWVSLQSMIIAGDETVEIHPAHGFSVVVATQEVSTSVEWQQSPTRLPFVIYLPACFDAYSPLPKSY